MDGNFPGRIIKKITFCPSGTRAVNLGASSCLLSLLRTLQNITKFSTVERHSGRFDHEELRDAVLVVTVCSIPTRESVAETYDDKQATNIRKTEGPPDI